MSSQLVIQRKKKRHFLTKFKTHRLKFKGFLSCSFIFLFHTFIILHFLKILIRACRNIAFFLSVHHGPGVGVKVQLPFMVNMGT